MDDAPPDSEDDSSISDDEILYRRIAHYGSGISSLLTRSPGTAALAAVPSSRTTTASRSISTASSPKLLWVRKISSVRRRTQVVAFRAAVPRQLSLGVVRDAWPTGTDDDNHPGNAAHALIVGFLGLNGKERRRTQKALAQSCTWVIDPGAPNSDP